MEVVPFGETALHRLPEVARDKNQALEERWAKGIWLGHARGTNETLVATDSGMAKVWAIRRLPPDQQWDGERVKRIIFHPGMVPARVILDPTLTVGLPPAVTAATGMDALSHCLEAWCAPGYHPMAEGIAVEGMRRVRDYLPRAYAHGDDLEARLNMLVASSMGATAFQRGLGAMHALAHPLGALYDAHHGTLNAILMPYVLKANERAIGEPMVRLCRYLDIRQPGTSSAIDWVLELRERLAIPHDLAAIGIDDAEAVKIGEMAVVDPSAASNPIAFTAEDYQRIFLAAQQGRL